MPSGPNRRSARNASNGLLATRAINTPSLHLLAPDGVFAETDARLAFMLLPAPTGGDLLAILDRVMRRVARRLDREEPDDPALADSPPELFAQLQAETATTWRSPASARRSVRGSDRLRAWCNGFSLHAGVVVPDHDGARPAFAHERLDWTRDGRISYPAQAPLARRDTISSTGPTAGIIQQIRPQHPVEQVSPRPAGIRPGPS